MLNTENRLYSELFWLWRLWGEPANEYARYCQFVIDGIRKYSPSSVQTLLDLGCGGGKNIYTLKEHFQITGLDLSPEMLTLAAELNPSIELIQADMRSFSLNTVFDVIFVDDAISYMTSKEDLAKVFQNCYYHLSPSGLMIVTPDILKEEFKQNSLDVEHSTPHPKHPDVEIDFLVSSYDPNPEDDWYESTFIYLIRNKGKLTIETDLHILGLFSESTWDQVLRSCGFTYETEFYKDKDTIYRTYFCTKQNLNRSQPYN